MHDRIAVVIPTRDRWPLLRMALASALAQREVTVDVVVVDDGSSDPTPERLRAIGDGRVHVLRRETAPGVSAARNYGLEQIEAPWVAFLDDDDVWAPGHLAAMLAAAAAPSLAAAGEAALVYCGHLAVDEHRRLLAAAPPPPLSTVVDGLQAFNVPGGPSQVLLRTDAVRAAGGFDEDLAVLADWDLWVRVLARGGAARSPGMLVGYMRHARGMHRDVDRLRGELAVLQAKHGWAGARERGPGPELSHDLAEACRAAGSRVAAARWYVRSGRIGRRPRNLARGAGILLGERAARLADRTRRGAPDPSLGAWLKDVRRADRHAGPGLPELWPR